MHLPLSLGRTTTSRTPSRTRLTVEALEDRLALAWGAVPPAFNPPPTSFTSVTLNSTGDATGNAGISSSEIDWYRFTATASGSYTFQSLTPSSSLDTVIATYNGSGTRMGYNDDISSTNRDSRFTVNLANGAVYYFGVTNYTGTAGGSYSWSINGPTPSSGGGGGGGGSTDDGYENNDTFSTAYNLGTLTSNRQVTGLQMRDSADWFRFTTSFAGGTGNSVSIDFLHSQGDLDMRLYNASGTQVAISQGEVNGESISLNGLAAGTYYVQVYGYQGVQNPGYSLSITPPTSGGGGGGGGGGTGGFQITLSISGMTSSQQAIFQQAANRWAQIITGDLPNATYNGTAVDDVLIHASGVAIDGAGGVLGQAGPDRFRSSSAGGLPYHGVMQFDTADLASLQSSGGLYHVILHEMGHVLGIGTLWQSKGLLTGAGTSNPRFIGARAVAEYNAIFGTNSTGVPVENSGGSGTRDAHWRESLFNNELMTGYLNNGGNPLSRITIASLADLGYTVNMAAADNYGPPGGSFSGGSGGGSGGGGSSLRAASDLFSAMPNRIQQLANRFINNLGSQRHETGWHPRQSSFTGPVSGQHNVTPSRAFKPSVTKIDFVPAVTPEEQVTDELFASPLG